MRSMKRVFVILGLLVAIVLIIFLAPVVPMPETGTSNGTISWITYGSLSYNYLGCFGASMRVTSGMIRPGRT